MFQLGRESTIEANGKTWVLSRLERRIVERFRDWIAQQEGDPFETVKALLSVLDPSEASRLIAEAKDIKRQLAAFSIGCPLAQRYLQTELGQAELLYLLLLDRQPQVTRDQAFALWADMGAQAFGEHLARTQGSPPKNQDAPAA